VSLDSECSEHETRRLPAVRMTSRLASSFDKSDLNVCRLFKETFLFPLDNLSARLEICQSEGDVKDG